MVALVGDAELDEGNIFEALLEGWKQGLRNCWWIIDYNRQSLDAVVREGLWERYEQLFKNFGWDVVIVKYGSLQQAAFKEPGGDRLRQWIDNCPNQLYSALVFAGGAAWRKRLTDEIGDQGDVTRLIEKRSDDELAALMNNLGGHDLPSVLEAFHGADAQKPTCFICYTVKGFGLPMAGHKDNHAGLMTPAQMEVFQKAMGVRPGHEWDKFEGLSLPAEQLQKFLDRVPFAADKARRLSAPTIDVPETLPVTIQPVMATQTGFGALLNEIGRGDNDFARRIVTTSPDVTVSTNLGPWVNRRGLFAREAMADTFKSEHIPSTFNWEFSPKGQHIELGIAEMNLFILLSALGLSHAINGERLLPIGTLYDPFIARGLDALNYACYQDARFIVVATPSGITLAGEGGAHQSIAEPLIGLAQDGLASFEPAYVDELAVIMGWAFAYIQKDGGAEASERNWLRDETGGSVYLRLSTRPVEQIQREMTGELRQGIVDGAYWLRKPGPNAQVVVAYTGAIAPEAIEAVGLMAEDRRDVGLLAVTSADRLNAGWNAAHGRRIGVARGDRRHHRGVDHPQAVDADHAQPRIDHGAYVVVAAHAGGADGMEDRGADIAGGLFQRGLVIADRRARQIFDRRIFLQRRLRHDFARDADRIGGDAAVLRRRQIIRLDRRRLRRVGGFERQRAAAGRPHIGDAGGEGRERVQRLAELVERQRLHVILDIGAVLRRIGAREGAELRRRHGHRPAPAQQRNRAPCRRGRSSRHIARSAS